MSIDKRKNYILMIDTETANTQTTEKGGLDMSDVLVYDIGWQVIDKYGNVYEKASFINRDIFVYERDLMQSAYYAHKIPQYVEDIRAGSRIMVDTWDIRGIMLDTINRYDIKVAAAHNARFDANALNRTISWITKGKIRYWFPFGLVEWWDTLRMSQDVICKMPTYTDFCNEYGYLSPTGKPRRTAEILYRYISGNHDFVESHTGLEDVEIETQILAYCYKQHKAMEKRLWPDSRDWPERTDFQRDFHISLRECPMLRV